MTLGPALEQARQFVRQRDLLALLYLLLLALIVVFPNSQIYRNLFYVAVLPCFALAAEAATLRAVARSWVWRFAVGLLFYLWLTLLWAERATVADFFNFARRAVMIALFLTVTGYLMASQRDFARRLFRWLVPVAAIVAVALTAWQATKNIHLEFWRAGTTAFPNANVTGAVYGTLVIGGIFYLFAGPVTRIVRLLYALALAVMLVFIVMTQSRGSLIALAATLLLLAGMVRRREALLIIAAVTVAFVAMEFLGIVDLDSLIRRGDAYRFEIWRHFWQVWLQRVWLGAGLTFDPIFTAADGTQLWHPHNIYLSHLVFGGIPALALLLLMLGAAIRFAFAAGVNRGHPALLGMVLFVAIFGLAEFSIFIDNANWQWLHFWLPLGLIMGTEAAAGARR